MKMNYYLLLPSICLLAATAAAQQTLRVPENFSSIQTAIDAAQTGDTVLVSPGIYYENLQLRGRNIILSSRYFLEPDPAKTIRETIIDGSQPSHPDTASCILIWKGESRATVIQGFTLQGGKGTRWYDHYVPGYFREGGGILSELSSPVIRHNIIRNNVVPKEGANLISHGGGAIRCGDGSPLIEGNYIVHNRADGYGGGIVFNYCPDAMVSNNVVAFNTGGKDYSGGGFWATGTAGTVVSLWNNTIAYNTSPGPATQYGGKAGGVFAFTIDLKLHNNIIWGNTQSTGKQILGSGADIQLEYNCVQGGYPGLMTTQTDPVFRDTSSFVLEAGSPAIDAGRPGLFDYSRNNRRAAFPARGTLHCDLGAYGGLSLQNPACPPSFFEAPIFSKVFNSPVVTTAGDSRSVNWIDIDNDSDLDLFISNGLEGGQNNMLYKNNGSGGFVAVTNDPIVQDNQPSDGATWADADNDGDVDCFVVNWYGVNNLYYKNNGTGSFTQVTAGNFVNDGGFSETASWGDYNNDGWLDLYVTNSYGNFKNFLYRNLQNGTFERITTGNPATDGFTSRCVNWTDFNNDGKPDLFVTNESNQHENLYQNNGDGTFTKITTGALVTAGGKTMSSSWGDYDNDGDLDVFLANDQGNDGLFRNEGNGSFTKITGSPVVSSGGNSFGSQWADVDNDADLDLFVTNSFWGGAWKNFLYINQGNGVFELNTTEVPATDEGWSYGCAFGDWDCDGDLDLGVATCYNADQTDYLYENHSAETGRNWLEIKLEGKTSNRSAIGAKIKAKALINGQEVTQLREISAQSGYCGQNQLAAHFGLADAESVLVTINWPSGLEEIIDTFMVNKCYAVLEPSSMVGTQTTLSPASITRLDISPNPSSDSILLSWEQEKDEPIVFQIINNDGKIIAHIPHKGKNGQNTWSIERQLPAGKYYLYISGTGWQQSAVFIRN